VNKKSLVVLLKQTSKVVKKVQKEMAVTNQGTATHSHWQDLPLITTGMLIVKVQGVHHTQEVKIIILLETMVIITDTMYVCIVVIKIIECVEVLVVLQDDIRFFII
jgi:aspartyl aminopeptidase